MKDKTPNLKQYLFSSLRILLKLYYGNIHIFLSSIYSEPFEKVVQMV